MIAIYGENYITSIMTNEEMYGTMPLQFEGKEFLQC